jgi:hypothetical protein
MNKTSVLTELIDVALSDGMLNANEMQQLRKKAAELGIPEPVLIDLVDSRRDGLSRSNHVTPGTGFTRVLRCPRCGEPIREVASICDWCGTSLTKLIDQESMRQFHERVMSSPLSDRSILISSYPLPLEKYEISAALSIAVPAARQLTDEERVQLSKLSGIGSNSEFVRASMEISRAWAFKAHAIINNARVLYAHDEAFIQNIAKFERELLLNEKYAEVKRSSKERNDNYNMLLGCIATIAVLSIVILLFYLIKMLT